MKVGSAATASVNPHCDSLGVGQIRLGRHRIPIISHDANALWKAAMRLRQYSTLTSLVQLRRATDS